MMSRIPILHMNWETKRGGKEKKKKTYLSTGNIQLDLSTVSTHQCSKLFADTLQNTQSIVLRKSVEKIPEYFILATATSNFL